MPRPTTNIVYTSCSKGNCIEVYTLDTATGTLTQTESMALPGNGMPLALAPDKRHLYAAVAGTETHPEPTYITFQIEPKTGRLTQRETVTAPGRMSHITVDRSGKNLLGASVSNDLVATHRISADGTLASEPTEVHTVPSKAHQITTDHTNRYAFVPNLGADLVMQLKIDAATGTLVDNSPPTIEQPAGSCPRHIAHHPNGRFVYLLNEEDGTIAAFTLDETNGTLHQFQTSNYLPDGFTGKPWGAQILTTPDGRFLYTSERTSSTLALHTINPETGRITKDTTWPTQECPRNFTISPSGHHLIAAGEKSNQLACYTIDAETGQLDLKSVIKTASGPLWVEVLELN